MIGLISIFLVADNIIVRRFVMILLLEEKVSEEEIRQCSS